MEVWAELQYSVACTICHPAHALFTSSSGTGKKRKRHGDGCFGCFIISMQHPDLSPIFPFGFENQHPAWFQTCLQSGVVCTQANSVFFLFLSCAHVEANNRAPEQCGGDEDRSEWANCSKQNLSGSDVHRSPYSSFTSDSKSLAICFELFYSVYSFIFQVCHFFLAKLFDFTCYTLFTCNFFN